jgi:hypothetical protein
VKNSNITKNAYRLFVRKPEGKTPLEDQDVDGWIELRWNFDGHDVVMRYVTNRKVGGSRPDEVNDFYQVT